MTAGPTADQPPCVEPQLACSAAAASPVSSGAAYSAHQGCTPVMVVSFGAGDLRVLSGAGFSRASNVLHPLRPGPPLAGARPFLIETAYWSPSGEGRSVDSCMSRQCRNGVRQPLCACMHTPAAHAQTGRAAACMREGHIPAGMLAWKYFGNPEAGLCFEGMPPAPARCALQAHCTVCWWRCVARRRAAPLRCPPARKCLPQRLR